MRLPDLAMLGASEVDAHRKILQRRKLQQDDVYAFERTLAARTDQRIATRQEEPLRHGGASRQEAERRLPWWVKLMADFACLSQNEYERRLEEEERKRLPQSCETSNEGVPTRTPDADGSGAPSSPLSPDIVAVEFTDGCTWNSRRVEQADWSPR